MGTEQDHLYNVFTTDENGDPYGFLGVTMGTSADEAYARAIVEWQTDTIAVVLGPESASHA